MALTAMSCKPHLDNIVVNVSNGRVVGVPMWYCPVSAIIEPYHGSLGSSNPKSTLQRVLCLT